MHALLSPYDNTIVLNYNTKTISLATYFEKN